MTSDKNGTIKFVRALTDNYIWIGVNEPTKTAWVVDPGDARPVITFLEKHDLMLNGILITHHHADHTNGIKDLISIKKNIPVYGAHNSPLSNITHRLREGDRITCGSIQFSILDIPGHTLDHIAFYNNAILFSGDTLFSIGCGKVFEGTFAEMYYSLEKLKQLPEETQLFCGHEYTLANLHFAHFIEPHNEQIIKKIEGVKNILKQNLSTLPSCLRDEKLLNPFFRCEDPALIHLVENHYNKKLTNPIDVFQHLREWKNDYK